MARLARIVVPGLPHHVTQRGNRREQVFFSGDDYQAYADLLSDALRVSGSEIWSWCLMPNHVHLIVVPGDEDGLRTTVAHVHRKYAGRINARNRWTGHLWQGRFGSVVMDEDHLLTAFAYVALNPVRARLVERAEDWPWSSVHAILSGRDDGITTCEPVLTRIPDFRRFLLDHQESDEVYAVLRRGETAGRPLGSASFTQDLERRLNRRLAPQKRGPKTKQIVEDGNN
ncbi:transposase [Coralliovum pocilloporae]|uniref:transposase n=1 Tax=Coralliovum pocilloporae TaxID=3066369 RepID=UPI003306FCCB